MTTISIILSTYNGAKYISRAIESILDQSFADWELIIICDDSGDKTESIVREYTKKDPRIIFLRNETNFGLTKSLNKGLKKAQGEYIAHIDDDDEWIDKDKLKKQVEFLEKNKEYVLVGAGAIVVNENKKELIRWDLPREDCTIRNKILVRDYFIHSSVVFRKDIVLKLGGYDENLQNAEDWDLWLKLGLRGKFYNFPEYMINYMIREGNATSRNRIELLTTDIHLIKKYKKYYPRYFQSILLAFIRLFIFSILVKFNFFKNDSVVIFKSKLKKLFNYK